jgi:DNA-directed RNA polymerase specialized sigma24 family protein
VIVLRYFKDLPVAETAELLGISPGTVKSYTARALAALREVLGDDADGIDEHTQEVSNAH